MNPTPHTQTLSATARFAYTLDFLPVALAFVEKSAQGFAFGPAETGSLVLATEELYTYYLGQAARGSSVELRLQDFGYQLVLTLTVPLAHPELQALNLTHRINPDSEESLATLGPMIAARSVTRLALEFGASGALQLRLTRVRDYPAVQPLVPPRTPPLRDPVLREASGEDLLHLATLVAGSGAGFVPPFLARPGLGADMLTRGDLAALVAQDGARMTGGVLWTRVGESTIEVFGPYLFCPDADGQQLAALLDEVVRRVSRSGARVLIRRQDRLANPARHFDFLGELQLRPAHPQAPALHWPHYFRQLLDDVGGRAVYADALLAGFLRTEYARLCLPRQVRELPPSGVQRSGASVLGVEFEHARSLATLRPLSAGRDMRENLDAHLALLAHEGIRNAIVEIDTARSEDTAFAPVLADLGFVPRLLVPDAGVGDLVLYTPQP